MGRERVTYTGAYHHVMNRGYDGRYGMYYRKMEGGHGYVFQSLFKSTIIEDDGYLIKSIEYLLQNPVRAGIVHRAENY